MEEEKKDKAEKDLDLVSDCEWVRALDASGKSIRIAKADMVELIRANMPVATLNSNGLMDKNYSSIYIPDRSGGANRYYKIGSVSNVYEGFKLLLTTKETGSRIGGIYFIAISGSENPLAVIGKMITIHNNEWGSHALYYVPNGNKSDIYIGSFTSGINILVLSPGTINIVDIYTQITSLPDGAMKLE